LEEDKLRQQGRSRRWRRAGPAGSLAVLALAVTMWLALLGAAAPGAAAASTSPAGTAASGHLGKPQGGTAPGETASATGNGRTVVSLTFDDGTSDQMLAAKALRASHLPATFYVITGAVGSPHYMTRADLRTLVAAGNEIGGHTVSHLDLVHVSAAEARRQICEGRDILARWGLKATSFAYPDGDYNRAVERMAATCGYGSARTVKGLASPGYPDAPAAESIPPADPYAIRVPGEVEDSWTLADLKQTVLRAERAGGGWVPLVFHHVCAGGNCGQLSVSQATFREFTQWLAQRAAKGTVVRTVQQVMGSPAGPMVRAKPAAPHGVVNPAMESAGPMAATNPSMETPDRSGAPACWMEGQFGKNSAHWQRIRDAHNGQWAERLVMRDFRSGGAQLVQLFDTGACSLPAQPGKSYQLAAWYKSNLQTQFAVYYRDGAGRWHYWASSPNFPASQGWARAAWNTPPVPAGASGISFGLSIFGNGTLVTDDYSFGRAAPDSALLFALGGVGATAVLLAAAAVIWRRPGRGSQPHPGSGPPAAGPPGGDRPAGKQPACAGHRPS
jgi:peptidoglycan/xylan/chitin deacetylase (PgdA/CDA1 family)